MKTFKYYQVTAKIDGQNDVLYGSYNRDDCKDEINAEKESWKNEGYKSIITTTTTTNVPDMSIYTHDEISA